MGHVRELAIAQQDTILVLTVMSDGSSGKWLRSLSGCAGQLLCQLPHSSFLLSVIEVPGFLPAILHWDVLIIDFL